MSTDLRDQTWVSMSPLSPLNVITDSYMDIIQVPGLPMFHYHSVSQESLRQSSLLLLDPSLGQGGSEILESLGYTEYTGYALQFPRNIIPDMFAGNQQVKEIKEEKEEAVKV